MNPDENLVNLTPPGQSTITKKVLLVEDDIALADIYAENLRVEGYEVQHIQNGENALAKVLEYKPDIVLLDIMMPKVSGLDVLSELRNHPETANTKIIILTALDQESDRERATMLKVDDYLVKSQIVVAEVAERIRHHLST